MTLINNILFYLAEARGPAPIYVCFSLIGTATIFFFTILLIPFQQYATQYTSSLFRYIRKNHELRVSFAGLVLIILLEGFLCYLPSTNGSIIISFFVVFITFILLGYLLLHITRILNPSEFLFEEIYKSAKKKIKQLKNDLKRKNVNDFDRMKELQQMMTETINTGEKIDPKSDFEVPRVMVQNLRSEIKILKEMAIKFIEKNQHGMFDDLLQVLRMIIVDYLECRKNYKSTIDVFLIDTSDDVRDLLKLCETKSNIYYFRSLWKELEHISISSLDVKVAGSESGQHQLCACFINIMRDRMISHLILKREDSAYEVARSLGEIALSMIKKGYIATAAEICKYLAGATTMALKNNNISFPVIGKECIAKIFYFSLNFRELFINYAYPFKQMVKCYDAILSIPGQTINLGISDPILYYSANTMSDMSISSLIRSALFPINDDENAIEYNLDVAEDLLILMKNHYFNNTFTQTSFTSQLYQAGLWFIAFLNHNIALDILCFYRNITIPNDKNRKKAKSLLFKVIEFCFDIHLDGMLDRKKALFNNMELMNNLLSLFYMIIYFNHKNKLNMENDINEVIEKILQKVKNNIKNISFNDTEKINIYNFCNFLGKYSAHKKQHKVFRKLLKLVKIRYSNTYKRYLISYIQRPKCAFDANFFARLDKDIFKIK